ncbi:MAG TPA: hypothetical protein PLI43_04750 [Albidovulum sp.]|uniref:hypothetical protein n=1 Tax=Albidovulum sp. TaxID=1872424 RepID=UPI002C62EC8C|nr:hypothetical protein [Albidovulum sp.]
MRFAVPAIVVSALLALPLPVAADPASQEAACISEASRQLGIATVAIKAIDVSPTIGSAIVTLSLPSQLATCIVTDANEVLEITSGDGRVTAFDQGWQRECIAIAATMQGVPQDSVAVGDNIGGQADLLVLDGQPMVCTVAADGSVQSVSYR